MSQKKQGGFLLAQIHQVGGRIFARLLKEHGVDVINPAQGRIMFVLWQEDGIAIQDLVQRTKLGKSTLTSMLERLEKTGLIMRVPCSHDRRKILIQRTPKDKELEHLYVKVSDIMTEIWYGGFTDPQIDRFEQDLKRILNNLTAFETG